MDESARKALLAATKRKRRDSDPDLRAREAAAIRQRRQADPKLRAREAEARRQRRQRANQATKAREAASKRQRRQQAGLEQKAREAAAKRQRRQQAGPEAKAREAAAKRLQRLMRTTGGTDARFKRDFLDRSFGHGCKDIGATHNVQLTCINCMLREGTLRRRPRRYYSKCIGKDDILPEHAHQSSQTEHHITLVWCPRPNILTCSTEVQVDLL
ncbi:uncharacterized protein LOC119400153 isoform X2 [Rhipicephalus sanguineus]|uniref:uncharacterized protein LOC119400153 isoform X2 n=1 Tax=Rhipicephalus sanguineus TaxID=34632 RepID=UPI00189400F0|nr:uncharacterized protein LOC119400153 isoform X2 [Rhipicephalus sanguineus]